MKRIEYDTLSVAEILDREKLTLDDLAWESFTDNPADYYEETGNAPCDISGICAGSSCFNYPKCQGWTN